MARASGRGSNPRNFTQGQTRAYSRRSRTVPECRGVRYRRARYGALIVWRRDFAPPERGGAPSSHKQMPHKQFPQQLFAHQIPWYRLLDYFAACWAHLARELRNGYASLGASMSPLREVLKGTMRP